MNKPLVARLQQVYKPLLLGYAFVLPIYYTTSLKLLYVLIPFGAFLAGKRLLDKDLLLRYKYPLLFIVISGIGIAYSSNWQVALSFMTDKAALALAFLAIAIASFDTVKLRQILLAFMFGTLAASIICTVWAVYRDTTEGAYWAYYHLVFTDIINSHPIYMGYFVNFSIIIAAYYMLRGQERKVNGRTVAAVIIIVFFVLIHIFLSGRIPLIAIAAGLGFWFVFVGLKTFRQWKLIAMVVVAGAAMIYFISYRSLVVDRFKDLFIPQQQVSDTQLGGYVERVMLWNAAIHANTNVLFGVGTGDAQETLVEYYKTHNFHPSYVEENYNAHNQYLQTYLGSGLAGMIILVLMFVDPVVRSFRTRNFIAFMFFSGFIFYGMTEVFLGRYQGAAFFFFFYPLLCPGLSPTTDDRQNPDS
jgi:O-antigen ligase